MPSRKDFLTAASKGFAGHNALLDPSGYADQMQPMVDQASFDKSLATADAQITSAKDPNKQGLQDRLKAASAETPLQQAMRELPGDLKDEFSPSGIANTSSAISEAFKNSLQNISADSNKVK